MKPNALMGYAPMQDGKTCVRVCSYCPDAAQADALAKREGLAVTHGICDSCKARELAAIPHESPIATD